MVFRAGGRGVHAVSHRVNQVEAATGAYLDGFPTAGAVLTGKGSWAVIAAGGEGKSAGVSAGSFETLDGVCASGDEASAGAAAEGS